MNGQPGGTGMRRYEVFSDHIRNLPLLEGTTVQLGRGTFPVFSDRAGGTDTFIVRLRMAPLMTGTMVPDPAWVVLMIPLRWGREFRFNGVSARRHDMFMSSGPNGYTTLGEERDTLAVAVRRSCLQAACAALQGVLPQEIAFDDLHLALGPAAGPWLQRRVLSLLSRSPASGSPSDVARLGSVMEADLISDLAFLLTERRFARRCIKPARLVAIEVVRTAIHAANADPMRPPSLADLCAATGVGQTWLYKSFMEIVGVSPMKLIRHQRLVQAREMLLDRSRPAMSVKYAAMSVGFMESGRFAIDYRAQFGENPSDTLQLRNTGNTGSLIPASPPMTQPGGKAGRKADQPQ